ncbi:MAG: hypothetical protein GX580_12720 [Candidatus Hydrogenedens sp.]|nr:lipid-A-disaccharide synthase N-terminal domain-containing protein [Candidatus Hydrogenedentota bacterium]NLF58488.1 hypothetical protein [Candidatus Hydrogenedens sp.]
MGITVDINFQDMGMAVLFWQTLGMAGAVIFYGRFYIQWLVSERQGRSVMPVIFWYMSGVGSVVLLLYGVFFLKSPVGALSHCFNSVIYARNLVHIWREKGVLTRRLYWGFQGAVAVMVLAGFAMVVHVWLHKYHQQRDVPTAEAARAWFWIGVGVTGQALFAARFLVQWAVTEARKKSTVPAVFWHLSLVASLLLMSSHLQQREWLYALGLLGTLPVYVRNIYFVHTGRTAPEDS